MRACVCLAAVVAVSLLGCSEEASTPEKNLTCSVKDPDNPAFEQDPPGRWLDGDLHVHATGASNDTGGDSSPEAIAKRAKELGLFFVVLTDHSNSTGSDATTTDEDPKLFNKGPEFPYWEKAAALSEPGKFVMIDGNEISPVAKGDPPNQARGHVGCIPTDLATLDRSGAFTDRPRGEVTGGQCVQQALDRGCFAVINHPYGIAPWIRYDWTHMGYNGLEVWNGGLGLDVADEKAIAAWKCDLLKGRKVTAIAASDNHRVHIKPPGDALNPPLGWPRTAVWAAEDTWPAIVAGLKAGRTALHTGTSFVQLDSYDSKGCRADKSISQVRARGKMASSLAGKLVITASTGCEDTRPKSSPAPKIAETTVFSRDLKAGESFDVAVEVGGTSTGPTVVLARIWPKDDNHHHAISPPVIVPASL